jgi:ketosteroid isomerase-like protein
MLEENEEIIRAAYPAFNRRDWAKAFDKTDAEFTLTVEGLPDASPRRGLQAAQTTIEEGLTAWDGFSYEVDELRESGEQIVALLTIRARPKGTTAEIENRVGHVWTLRDGKVVSIHTFPDREQALEAAGLSD